MTNERSCLKDGNGEDLKVGDRVYSYDAVENQIIHGTLCYNDDGSDYPYYVSYDDGEDFKVISFGWLFKSNQ